MASLNYECVLDLVAKGLGVPVEYQGAPRHDRLVIWKPHGACNLVADVGGLKMFDPTFTQTNHYIAGFRILAIPPSEVPELYAADPPAPFPPAFSLFAPTKHSPVEPEVIQRARGEWQSWVGGASHIIVIGAYPLLEDAHIWDAVLNNPDAEVWYVSGTEPGGYDKFSRRLGSRLSVLGPRFDAAIESLVRRLSVLAP